MFFSLDRLLLITISLTTRAGPGTPLTSISPTSGLERFFSLYSDLFILLLIGLILLSVGFLLGHLRARKSILLSRRDDNID